MSLLGNILWFFLGGGIFIALEYLLGGLVLIITIIGIPFGVQCMKLAVLGVAPFGREIVDREIPTSPLTLILNILWIVCGGIWVSVTHLIFAVLCAITIIGIPFAVQHMKLAALAFTPFGKVLD